MEHKLRKIYFTIVMVAAILAAVAAVVFAIGFDKAKKIWYTNAWIVP